MSGRIRLVAIVPVNADERRLALPSASPFLDQRRRPVPGREDTANVRACPTSKHIGDLRPAILSSSSTLPRSGWPSGDASDLPQKPRQHERNAHVVLPNRRIPTPIVRAHAHERPARQMVTTCIPSNRGTHRTPGMHDALANQILDTSNAGLANGERYRDASRATDRAAWKVVAKLTKKPSRRHARSKDVG